KRYSTAEKRGLTELLFVSFVLFEPLCLVCWRSLLRLVISPQPPHRVRQNGPAVFAVVAFGAPVGFVVVFGELQRRRHLLIRQEPVAMDVIQVVAAVLEENADRLGRRFADERGIEVAAAAARNVGTIC